MFEQDSVWLSQHQIAELFKQSKQNISIHVGNVFKEGELQKVATVKDYLTVQSAANCKVKRKNKSKNKLKAIVFRFRTLACC